MYKSPFGSLFSSDDSKKPTPEPKPVVKTSPSDSLGRRTAELKSSKVINPNIESLKTKKAYGNTTPQFKSLTTMKSDDIRVMAEHSKILVEKNKQKLAAFNRRLGEIEAKIKAAKVYRDVLIQYRQLSATQKQILAGWVIQHSDAIKKLSSARRLSSVKKNTSEAVKALDAEITHWENLLQLKKDGVNIQGKIVLKNYRPVEKMIRNAADTGDLPVFKSKPFPSSEIYRLKSGNKSVKSQNLGSLGASDEASRSLNKMTGKKSYKDIFVEDLPGKNAILDIRNAKGAGARLQKKTEKTIVRAKELDWQIQRIQDKIDVARKEYEKVQETLGELTVAMSKDPQTKNTIDLLGVLLEARPERFLSAPTLLDAAKGAFKRLSQLGSEDSEVVITPEKEAEEFLIKASEDSASELKELEIRQNALEQLKAEVEGRPAPPPIKLVSDEPLPPPPSKARKTAGTINKLLPWAAGLFLLMKIMEK